MGKGKHVSGGGKDLPVPPDGGWGWLVVLGSFIIHIIADGIVYSFGVFYIEFLHYFGGGRGETAWVGSLVPGVTLTVGPIASALTNRYGCRIVTILGAVIASTGFIISVFATKLHHLYFSFGILSGLGFGLIYLPAIVSVGYYFEKRRAFATGIAVCGSGLGAFIFAPLTKTMLDEYGWKGTILIEAGLILNCVVCGALFRPLKAEESHSVDEPPEKEKLLREYKNGGVSVKTSNGQQPLEMIDRKPKPPPNGFKPSSLSDLEKGQSHAINGEKRRGSLDSGRVSKELPSFFPEKPHGDNKHHSHDRHLGAGHVALFQKVKEASRSERKGSMLHSDGAIHRLHIASIKEHIPTHHVGPMYRKDILYAASLHNLAEFNEDHTKYITSITSIPDQLPPEKEWRILRCFSPEIRDAVHQMLDFSLLKDVVFMLFVISNFFTSIGFNMPFIYLPDRAEEAGIDSDQAAFLVSVIGIANTFGRVFFGWLADRPGMNRLMLYNSALVICGISTAITPFWNQHVALIIYAAVFGLFIGVYVSLTSVVLVDLLGLDKLTNSFGLLLLFQGFATLIGPPIAGWLYDWTGDYDVSFNVSGAVVALSGLMLFVIPLIRRFQKNKPGDKRTTINVNPDKNNGIPNAIPEIVEELVD